MFRKLKNFVKIIFGGYTSEEQLVKAEFDSEYYLSMYGDVKKAAVDPLKHYMRTGWREGRNPNAYFNTISYLLCNPDVFIAGVNPLFHYINTGRAEGRQGVNEEDTIKKFLGNRIFDAVQDITFPIILLKAEKIMVIVVPEYPTMSGGIYSMYSISNIANRLKSQHGYEIVLMTRPNSRGLTYYRQQNFRNSEVVFRFDKIMLCQNVKELYLHIPEYAATDFVEFLPDNVLEYLKSRDRLYVNILNQNSDLMPEAGQLVKLRDLADELTQSVAHHAYFSQSFADKYDLPTLLLPAYTDLSAYASSTFDEKEKLIIYSHEEATHKACCLEAIQKQLPDFELVEIRDITFDEYMNYATRCLFSISFGEGFDGYIAQPIYQGGLGFTVYNDDFFPSQEFKRFDNFFESEEQMLEKICDRIKYYADNRQAYMELNAALVDEYDKLYQYDDYVMRVNKLINREFELYPRGRIPSGGIYRVN